MNPDPNKPRVSVVTAAAPGAVAIIQIQGPGVGSILLALTASADWPQGHLKLCQFGSIDQGLATLLRPDWAQLMPHGGPRVVQLLIDRLVQLGAEFEPRMEAWSIYPEAASELEADMLATLALAASPLAIDLLLAQPALWHETLNRTIDDADLDVRSTTLDRLIHPPTLAILGRPNVGKSTLTNRMLGRSVSVVADLPGTTRDWVAGLTELSGVAVRWLDTPGIRQSDDPIEQRAIELAAGAIAHADLLVALCDPQIDWPDLSALPRRPDLWVMNKMDLAPNTATGDGQHQEAPLPISAQNGMGLDLLEASILRALGITTPLRSPTLWAFSAFLRSSARHEPASLKRYVTGQGD